MRDGARTIIVFPVENARQGPSVGLGRTLHAQRYSAMRPFESSVVQVQPRSSSRTTASQ